MKQLLSEFNINPDVVDASDHPGYCRCDKCLKWWVAVGPEELDNGVWSFGPFTHEEALAAGGRIPTESK